MGGRVKRGVFEGRGDAKAAGEWKRWRREGEKFAKGEEGVVGERIGEVGGAGAELSCNVSSVHI